ncbi:MAG: DEAD/DEAH box helicase [Mucispirillum sp.]|uniref:DNA 3'-5' helicase n=1 Tax=Candidatus Mucispirillum faecigallinarum TaxID=2838699 RepID=A0A9D2KDV4_9BACT|nr:DEAD/DEAH box helicase [Mucispirillum sp.]HIZ90428.1 DEAD/DEAH box helicase [Candidatus Mucispirillum faecigallinarum]
MANKEYIKNLLNNKIQEHSNEENVAFVIKGIPLDIVEFKDNINIEILLKNKVKYFTNIYELRNLFIYEEFLLLNGIITEQYDKIYIINNNLYSKYFPLEIDLKNNIINNLEEQFIDIDEIDYTNEIYDTNDEKTDNLLQIIDGILLKDNLLICGYNDTVVKDWYKINLIDLFNNNYLEKKIQNSNQTNNIFIIEDDFDYTVLVNNIINNEQQQYILDISRYSGNQLELLNNIKLLNDNIENIKLYIYKKLEQEKLKYTEESKSILNKYWGYDKFRTFEIYNIEKLEENHKEYLNISQEEIISDIINESENNVNNKYFRDIFVTAPTGIGKSIMFQIPAIYLAEKYNYVTIVISPLIGLMNDQVRNLEIKNYKYVKTINSDISPIKKEEIKEQISNGEVHILYISPETLLSRSDIENLIGDRTIGLLVIDEAHIVTTWGKQFRPDYWYLGDHIRKLRKKQSENKNISFIIAAFSATVIYKGKEDMYNETINSLHMRNPISYIGSIIRKNIEINVNKLEMQSKEYKTEKFKAYAYHFIMRSNNTGEKILIYFPYVSLILEFYEFLQNNQLHKNVAFYYGSLPKEEKNENYEQFYKGNKKIMLATKAFGMGIDIDDISVIAHFAPTGNVCDYVQEIGRVARKPNMQGEACYLYNKQDFKYINSLHGISTIKKYQLVEVLRKIYELAIERKNKQNNIRRKNSMLLDVDNFTYIFNKGRNDEDNNINKVKTALLLIEKDFENMYGFSPIKMRPVPMYSKGFFKIDEKTAYKLNEFIPNILYKVSEEYKIYQIDLKTIWETTNKDMSFPMFKYYVYTKNNELAFNLDYNIEPIWKVEVNIKQNIQNKFMSIWTVLKECINKSVYDNEYILLTYIVTQLKEKCNISESGARFIIDVILTSIDEYKKNHFKYNNTQLLNRPLQDGRQMYKFDVAINHYLKAVEGARISLIEKIHENNGILFFESNNKNHKWLITVLGILETFGILNFTILGGENRQIYIYLYQTLKIYNIINNADHYNNRLLENIYERHKISVEMLKNLFENNYTSDERWEIIEDYFLGIEHS